MIFLYIYLILSGLCLIMYTLSPIDIAHKFKLKYPGLKYPKTNWAKRILSGIKVIVVSFIPIMHLGLIWVVLFDYETLETKALTKLYEECVKM